EECGTRLVSSCASCGEELTPEKKFCGACGAPVSPEPVGRQPSSQSYTPKHLAEKILTSRHALEGERKQVTVLFADLKGSMELLADRDPEEARRLLDPVLARTTSVLGSARTAAANSSHETCFTIGAQQRPLTLRISRDRITGVKRS